MVMLGLDAELEAKALISHFEKMGLTFEVAKKCAIKTIREKITELTFMGMVHSVDLEPRIEIHRPTILYIVEM